uniref:Ribonuclease HII n=1 Tax=uncultured bacterium contig00160 TaxID=1181593 RepID=A0A806KKV5_9BACT|nr:ribonuclease HII [uncultured bacterium contig00160]
MICGIDEAGRGPLAGPVYAATVVLNDDFPCNLLNDSKKLSASKREELRKLICEKALAWGIGWASHEEIDSINILQASLLAMKRAFEEMLKTFPSALLQNISAIVDGNKVPDISVPCTAMVKADAKVHEVMAASILAKTARDSYMEEMAKLYPQYEYEKHKGYPTKAHRELIHKYGPSPIQRLTFTVK